jgi:hypothetical protein
MGRMRNTKLLLASLKGRDHLEDLGIVRKIILELILGLRDIGRMEWTEFI